MTPLRIRRQVISERVMTILARGPKTLPQLLDTLHRESQGEDRIAEWDIVPVLSLLLEDGVIDAKVAEAKMGKGTSQQMHYMMRVG